MTKIYLYDSTLRDGSQARGVDFTLSDKIVIASALDKFGINYIEGGFPSANPKDDEFFANPPKMKNSNLTAFGMTCRVGENPADNAGIQALLNCNSQSVCIVGKSWDFHIKEALCISETENLQIIKNTIICLAKKKEVLFDAEHFFDGYKANNRIALATIKTAFDAGARWIVLCDTNGGTLPHEISSIITDVAKYIPNDNIAIHCHNDAGCAIANSLAAVDAGARQIQGTINGVGERCGNANLISLIPTLNLKLGYDLDIKNLTDITKLSRIIDDRLNRAPDKHAPYVGAAAFAHKGGLHASAIAKNPLSYEHIEPKIVGNERAILISDKAGKANLLAHLKNMGLADNFSNKKLSELIQLIKDREIDGYAYEDAEASFEMLLRRSLNQVPEFFKVISFRTIDERRWNAKGELITISEASIKLEIDGNNVMEVAEGNGPVNALDKAIRKALSCKYPALQQTNLSDYKVRILTPSDGTEAVTRVLIETRNGKSWNTIGVSANIIDASFNALYDSITYYLLKNK